MSHSYLLLTPVLTLLVVLLVGFVGCDALFGIDHVDWYPGPTSLHLEPGNAQVILTWQPPATSQSSVSGYRITRRLSSETQYKQIQDVPKNQLDYTDTDGLVNGNEYCYRVATLAGGTPYGSADDCVIVGYTGLQSLIMPTQFGALNNNFGGYLGMGMHIGAAPVEVKTLGRFKVGGNMGTHIVKLVDAATKADVPGGSVSVDLSGGNAGEFVYGTLAAPVTLSAGLDYYLISEEMNNGDQYYDSALTRVDAKQDIRGPVPVDVVTRVYAVNGDGAGMYTVSPTDHSTYGPVDLQY